MHWARTGVRWESWQTVFRRRCAAASWHPYGARTPAPNSPCDTPCIGSATDTELMSEPCPDHPIWFSRHGGRRSSFTVVSGTAMTVAGVGPRRVGEHFGWESAGAIGGGTATTSRVCVSLVGVPSRSGNANFAGHREPFGGRSSSWMNRNDRHGAALLSASQRKHFSHAKTDWNRPVCRSRGTQSRL